MKDLWAIIKHEAQQLLSKPVVIALLLILAAGLGFILYHTIEYKDLHAQKAIFQDVEKTKIDMYSSYRQYASFGFRVLFSPAPISILFANSSVFQDMTAYIDSGERLNIYKPLKSKNIFGFTKYIFADFSGIFLVFVGLIALFYGFPAFRSQEYLKTLASIADKKNLFRNILLARAILLAFYSLIFLFLAVLLIAINGVSIGIDQYLVLFFLEMCGVTAFFLVLGSAFGSSKSLLWGLGGIIICWLILLLIVPFLLDLIVSVNAASIKPETQLEIEKLTLMMKFEKRFSNETGIVPIDKTVTDIQKKLVLGYYKNEFQAMQKLEDLVKAQMQECIKLHYRLSSFFPTTFYQSLTNELSSKGYETLESFYNTVKQIKEAFFKEYMKQLFLSSQPAKVEPFLKGDENIFEGKPALPGYLILGFFFNLAWIFALAIPAYYGFKKNLFELPENKKTAKTLQDVELQRGTFKSWRVIGSLFYLQMYNLLSGNIAKFMKQRYTFQVSLDGQVLNTSAKKQNFIALSHPTEMPENLKVNAYTRLIMDLSGVDKEKRKEIEARCALASFRGKRFNQLDMDELGQVFLAILDMKLFDIYLLNDVSRDMSYEFCLALKKKMDELKDSGALVLFLYSSTDNLLTRSANSTKYFVESNHWYNMVESSKDLKDDETDGH
ncbi:MAG: ABC transporter permease subunit [Candidatus Aminicenantes bacterium]|nr:ABC transporter permease subunit [Candidatus Aminicenantes bacterium]